MNCKERNTKLGIHKDKGFFGIEYNICYAVREKELSFFVDQQLQVIDTAGDNKSEMSTTRPQMPPPFEPHTRERYQRTIPIM